MRSQSVPTEPEYRFGYQGKYAEKDDETGWNHFEFREYDPIIGRPLSVDPRRQFFSPYVWVGNNPIRGTDPTGGEGEEEGGPQPGLFSRFVSWVKGLFSLFTCD